MWAKFFRRHSILSIASLLLPNRCPFLDLRKLRTFLFFKSFNLLLLLLHTYLNKLNAIVYNFSTYL